MNERTNHLHEAWLIALAKGRVDEAKAHAEDLLGVLSDARPDWFGHERRHFLNWCEYVGLLTGRNRP